MSMYKLFTSWLSNTTTKDYEINMQALSLKHPPQVAKPTRQQEIGYK